MILSQGKFLLKSKCTCCLSYIFVIVLDMICSCNQTGLKCVFFLPHLPSWAIQRYVSMPGFVYFKNKILGNLYIYIYVHLKQKAGTRVLC